MIAKEPKTIGEHLRRRRAQLGLHQRQAAAILHVSMVTLSKWEYDKIYPTWEYHARLIDYLGYDVFKLVPLKDPYSNETLGVAFLTDGQPIPTGQRIRRKRMELKLTRNEA